MAEEYRFSGILKLARDLTGTTIPETHRKAVECFCADRGRCLGVSVSDYLHTVEHDMDERGRFIDAVTINETYCFREERHFDILNDTIFPLMNAGGETPVTLWSAACSSGEEALSLALLAGKNLGPGRKFTVYASDINPECLSRMKRHELSFNSFRGDGRKYHSMIMPYVTENGRMYTYDPALLSNIIIKQINLSDSGYPAIPDNLDVVFLRNTLIYFEFTQRLSILDKISRKLREGGCLFLASSEMPLISHPSLQVCSEKGSYFFRKKSLLQKKIGATVAAACLEEDSSAFPSNTGLRKRASIQAAADLVENRKNLRCIDTDLVCEYASQVLNSHLFELSGDDNYKIALRFLDLQLRLNAGNISESQLLLDSIAADTGESYLTRYFRGYQSLVCGNKSAASDLFRCSLNLNTEFWPARYYLGKVLLELASPRGINELEKCRDSIRKYIANDKYNYQFLLDGFNAQYFLQLCDKQIEKRR